MAFYNMTKTKKIQPEIRNKKDVETLNSSNYAHCKTETNTNTNINSFNTTLNNNIENKNILSNINHNESVESDDKNNEYDYNNQIIDNQNDSDNPTNIDKTTRFWLNLRYGKSHFKNPEDGAQLQLRAQGRRCSGTGQGKA